MMYWPIEESGQYVVQQCSISRLLLVFSCSVAIASKCSISQHAALRIGCIVEISSAENPSVFRCHKERL